MHFLTLGRLKNFPKTPFEEAKNAAKLIAEKLRHPVLCLSGGLDSEAMALAFLAAKVKFTAAIMNLENGLNDYDIAVAKAFCIQHGIQYQEIHIPALKVLESGEHLDIANKYRTLSPERALFILFMQQINGNPVVGGEILRKECINGAINYCCPKDRDFSYWRYLSQNKIAGVPYFHYYTPELAVSFMAHTRIGNPELEAVDWSGKHREFYDHKLSIYKEAGFAVAHSDLRLQKWHGFEGLKRMFDSHYHSQNAYTNAFRKPLEENPVYDLNQLLLVDEDDPFAQEILVGE